MKFILEYLMLSSLFFHWNNNPNNIQFNPIESEIKQIVYKWNRAHNSKDLDGFNTLYDDNVFYYGKLLNKSDCIENKLVFLKKYPDFAQQISGEIQIKVISDKSIKCNFTKNVTINEKTKEYPAYLIFTKVQNFWKITTEGDLVTDRNLARKNENLVPKEAISGDFDGDGKTEFLWLVPPEKVSTISGDNFGKCKNECNCYLEFSNKKLPSLELESCIGGIPINEGDLDGNGTDEIGILPYWWTSCWRGYLVYTFKNNNWKYLVDPISTHCIQWEEGVDAIKRDNSKNGYVIINYSDISDTDIGIFSKSIQVNK